MKKIISILWMALLIALSAFSIASAEEIDLSSMTLGELKVLQGRLEAEIASRESNGETIERWFDYGTGKYLPKPILLSGKELKIKDDSFMNNDVGFYAMVEGTERGDLNTYVLFRTF